MVSFLFHDSGAMDAIKLPCGLKVPFPVETPFAMRPNLRPWSKGEPIVIRDLQFESYIAQKKQAYGPVFGDNPDLALLRRAVALLQIFDPAFEPAKDPADLVYSLTMELQEDWVLMAANQLNELSAQILSVHFPSGWDPKEKAGMCFSELHEPVADNGLIMRAAAQISKTISSRGPFIRHVWSIANTGSLSRRPDLIPKTSDLELDRLWFRCERQTTIPVDGIAALFLIRVFVVPLSEVFQDPNRKQAVIDSIRSMSEAVVDYKGYGQLRAQLKP